MKIKFFLLLFFVFMVGCSANIDKQVEKPSFEKVKVIKHVDGDTVYIQRQDGTKEKVRFIGVNTPETKHPKKGIETYGKEASNYTKTKILNKTVYLEKDISEKDKYNRLLRYVWTEEPAQINEKEIRTKMFNACLLLEGFAQVSTFPPDVKYQETFKKLQKEARELNKGLWQAK